MKVCRLADRDRDATVLAKLVIFKLFHYLLFTISFFCCACCCCCCLALFLKKPLNKKLCCRASISSSNFFVPDCRFSTVTLKLAADCWSCNNTPARLLLSFSL